MSNHNYTQYSNYKKNADVVEAVDVVDVPEAVDVVEPIEPVVYVEETEAPVVTLAEETVETVSLPEMVKGVVINCTKLNVRIAPNAKADIACRLDAKSEVEIDVSMSTDDWFRVCTAAGVNGYCMKQYIDARL